MTNDAENTRRRERLDALAKAIGGKAELGRRLHYKDGAFVGQMIKGDRPITEKTIEAVHKLTGYRGWFEKNTEREPIHAVLRQPLRPEVAYAGNTEGLDQPIPLAMPYSASNLNSTILLLGNLLGALDQRSREMIGHLLKDLASKPDDAADVAAKASALATAQKPLTSNHALNLALTRPDAQETTSGSLFSQENR